MKTLKELKFTTLCALYLFGYFVLVLQYLFLFAPSAYAQSISGYTATLIGGTTNGVTNVCCNGVVLDFDSVNPLNLFILDGEALFDPILSTSYDHGNEFTSGYNVVGTIMPWTCITVESECYSVEVLPRIRTIGTGGKSASI